MEGFELPAGWEIAELAEVCSINPTIDKSAIADDLAVSFVPMPAVEAESGGIDVSATRKFGEVKKGYTPFREGDVLFAKITPSMENGKMAVVPSLHNGLGFGSTEFHVLRAHTGISPLFVYYFVSSRAFRHVAEHNMSGAVGQRRVTTPYLSACKIPVPPTAEQHRIVAKIEELFSELDQGVASLKTARKQLKVYRQSLLKNAFEGKLTAAWRAAHADQLETAAALQQRIARERQARYQQQLADWQTAGHAGPKPKPPKPLPPLTAEELAELPELPAGWGWMKLGSLASQITDGEHFRPATTEQGIPFLSAKDVRADGVSFDAPLFISPETAEKAWARCHPERSDILIVSRGATVGRMCAVNTDQSFCLLGSVILIKVTPATLPAYLLAALKTPFVNKRIVGASGATAQQAIYLRDIQAVPVAVCSLAEQFEIVQELESKLSEADQLDQTLATALQQAVALRQSILKKAFCGQLVKQDKNEEPATALLERIRAAKSNDIKKPVKRGKAS
jgi:type I restriction enzyme, S subunit